MTDTNTDTGQTASDLRKGLLKMIVRRICEIGIVIIGLTGAYTLNQLPEFMLQSDLVYEQY